MKLLVRTTANGKDLNTTYNGFYDVMPKITMASIKSFASVNIDVGFPSFYALIMDTSDYDYERGTESYSRTVKTEGNTITETYSFINGDTYEFTHTFSKLEQIEIVGV